MKRRGRFNKKDSIKWLTFNLINNMIMLERILSSKFSMPKLIVGISGSFNLILFEFKLYAGQQSNKQIDFAIHQAEEICAFAYSIIFSRILYYENGN